jgi:hypothetical protein
MELREAAQMALDAMLNFPDDISDDMFESIKALRAALAQPEPPCATGSQCVGNKCERCAVQEPVAWMHNFIDEVVIAHRPVDLDRHPDRWTALYKDPTPCQTCEALARTIMMDQTSHDTPPQREWQRLTDEEIEDACWTEVDQRLRSFSRAIEAKLREKNFDRPS